jgi:hypothetical protein
VQDDGLLFSDFEQRDDDELEIFNEKSDEILKATREAIIRWFQ